jgi:hypothetical protein
MRFDRCLVASVGADSCACERRGPCSSGNDGGGGHGQHPAGTDNDPGDGIAGRYDAIRICCMG